MLDRVKLYCTLFSKYHWKFLPCVTIFYHKDFYVEYVLLL